MRGFGGRAFLLLALAGLGLSGYLTVLSVVRADLSFCEPYPFLSCEAVIYSSYARILGVPVALVGAGGFAGLFLLGYGNLTAADAGRRLPMGMVILSLLGLAFGSYLTYVELAILRSLCILCFASFLLILPLLGLSLLELRASRRAP